MHQDEQAIREMIAEWLRASAEGDLPRVLQLMAEDVVFLVPGRPPMRGREGFAAGFNAAFQRFDFAGESTVQEVQVMGDWAYCWTQLSVTMIPRDGGPPVRRSGPTLSVLRKQPDGGWVIARDANMLAVEPAGE